MKSTQTTQNQRNEGNNWTEREKQVATQFGVEPKTVRLIDGVVQYHLNATEKHLAAGNGGEQDESRKIKDDAKKDLEKRLCNFNKRFQHGILREMLEDVTQTTCRADKLLSMRGRIKSLFGRMDSKTKSVITVFQELTKAESCSVGIDFVSDEICESIDDEKFVTRALEENPQDEDVHCLAEIFELCRFINENN